MAEAIKSANSARPSSLGKPVPGADAQAELDAFLADSPAPQIPTATPAAPAASAEAAPQGAMNPQAELDSFMAGEGQFAPEPSFMQANVDQFKPQNFIDRVKTGLAANDTEKMGYLKQKYGESNVKLKDDKIYFRRDPKDKFSRLDPKTLEVVSDLLPDFGRELVTEAAMLPGEIIGGGAGFGAAILAKQPLQALKAAKVGALAGRVASVPLANAAADEAAKQAGIPQDPNRSRMTENVIGMGLEGALPVVGSYLARTAAKRIPGTLAYKEAKDAGESELVALTKQSKEVVSAANALEQAGVIHAIPGESVGVPGAKFSLMLHQIEPGAPKVQSLLKSIADAPQLLNAETKQAEAYGSALTNTLTEIARQGGHGPVAPENLGSVITNAVGSLDKIERESIGRFTAKAMAATKNAKVPLAPELQQQLAGLTKEFGFKVRTTPGGSLSVIPPQDLKPLVGKFGMNSVGEVRSFVNNLDRIAQLSNKGGLRLNELGDMRNLIGEAGQSLRGTRAGKELSFMSGQLRKQYREVIGNALGDQTDKAAFNTAMDKFGMIRENTEQLSDLLRNDTTAKTVVNGFFKGKENLANIRALKAITGENSPQWAGLKEEFVNQLLLKHASKTNKTGFNSGAMLNDLEKTYGSDFMREALGGKNGPSYDTVKQLLTYGQRIESTAQKMKVDQASEQAKKSLVGSAIELAADLKFKSVNGITAVLGGSNGRKNALFEILNQDGVEKYVSGYSKKLSPEQKTAVTQNLKDMLAQYKFMQKIAENADTAGRVARPIIREEAMREDQ